MDQSPEKLKEIIVELQKEIAHLRFHLSRYKDWGLEKKTAEYWEDLYWKTTMLFGNIKQETFFYPKYAALKIRCNELESMLHGIRVVGDTVYINYHYLRRLVKTFKPELKGSARSRYAR